MVKQIADIIVPGQFHVQPLAEIDPGLVLNRPHALGPEVGWRDPMEGFSVKQMVDPNVGLFWVDAI